MQPCYVPYLKGKEQSKSVLTPQKAQLRSLVTLGFFQNGLSKQVHRSRLDPKFFSIQTKSFINFYLSLGTTKLGNRSQKDLYKLEFLLLYFRFLCLKYSTFQGSGNKKFNIRKTDQMLSPPCLASSGPAIFTLLPVSVRVCG